MTGKINDNDNGSVKRPDHPALDRFQIFPDYFSAPDIVKNAVASLQEKDKVMKPKIHFRENRKALLDYALDEQRAIPKKLTLALPSSYQDLLIRMSLLNGTSKTDIVKQALDELSSRFGDSLYPTSV